MVCYRAADDSCRLLRSSGLIAECSGPTAQSPEDAEAIGEGRASDAQPTVRARQERPVPLLDFAVFQDEIRFVCKPRSARCLQKHIN